MNFPALQLPEPPIKKPRKNAAANPRPRKNKKGDASGTPEATTSAGGAPGAAIGAPMFKKPGRPRGSGASKAATVTAGAASSGKGGGKGRKEKADDDELELVAKDEAKVDEEPEERLGKDHVGVFAKDLPWLMYGFGDADKPLKETVDLVEDIAVQFITDVVHSAMSAASARNPGGLAGGSAGSSAAKKDDLRLEDLLYAVRRDPRKVARIQELIRRQQEIKEARKVMDVESGAVDIPD